MECNNTMFEFLVDFIILTGDFLKCKSLMTEFLTTANLCSLTETACQHKWVFQIFLLLKIILFDETSQHCSVFCTNFKFAVTFVVSQLDIRRTKNTFLLCKTTQKKTDDQKIDVSIRVGAAKHKECNVASRFLITVLLLTLQP